MGTEKLYFFSLVSVNMLGKGASFFLWKRNKISWWGKDNMQWPFVPFLPFSQHVPFYSLPWCYLLFSSSWLSKCPPRSCSLQYIPCDSSNSAKSHKLHSSQACGMCESQELVSRASVAVRWLPLSANSQHSGTVETCRKKWSKNSGMSRTMLYWKA